MRLRLHKLQAKDKQSQKTRAEHSEDWHNINGALHYQGLFYVPEIIRTKLISKHHDDPLTGYFDIEKTHELVARKYYRLTLRHDVEDYVKRCDICLASKTVWHKLYGDLQSLPIPTTAKKINWWILSRVCQFWWIGRGTAMTWYLSSSTASQRWFITSQSRLLSILRAL